ncbi:MAG TPA: hypothetical protein VEO95_06400 [Chthoniobacteraceae bacterium]|nr:hypothetical protein [Chthoniobacteraceae bacterium]
MSPRLPPEPTPIESLPEPHTRARTTSLRSVRCIRCSEQLFYPARRSNRTAMLYCDRCGARTRIPTARTRVLQAACVVFYLAALALVILAAMRKG